MPENLSPYFKSENKRYSGSSGVDNIINLMGTIRRNTIRLFSCLCASGALFATSCSDSTEEPAVPDTPKSHAMTFDIPDGNLPDSRTQITSDNLTEFTVWASMRSLDGGDCTPVFTKSDASAPDNPPAASDFVTVRKESSGSWNYAYGNQNLAYWSDNSFYSFAAFAISYGPSDTQTVVPDFATNGHTDDEHAHTLSFDNFDGTQSTDLVYAAANRMVSDFETDTRAVNLTFNHLTSRLMIQGRVDPNLGSDHSVTVISVSLSGINTRGSWDGAAFDPAATTDHSWTSSTPGEYAANDNRFEVNTSGLTDLFNGKDIMMIPQAIDGEARLTVRYSHNSGMDAGTIHTVTLNIHQATVAIGASSWLPGRSYRYTVNFGATDYILFDTPTVEKWDYQVGGNIIVQPNQ